MDASAYQAIDDLTEIKALMTKYRDLPMDFADATLVQIANREKISRIFTLDRRDFSVYHAVFMKETRASAGQNNQPKDF
jgi:predicted nucleic acid-binding protein